MINEWGYSYCNTIHDCATAAAWVSGDADNAVTGYAGLPLYTDGSVKLADSTSPQDTTLQFKIAAVASDTQASGTYTNVINFVAITGLGS